MLKKIYLIFPFVLTEAVLYCYFENKQFLSISIFFILFYLKIGWRNAFLVSAGLVLVTLLLYTSLTLVPNLLYYRPHERFQTYDTYHKLGYIYEPRTQIEMKMPFGDIEAMSHYGVQEPRRVRFVTDSLGFRNTRDYHGQNYVLIGDSFIAGVGSSQECTLNELLFSSYHIDTYNLSNAGGLAEYSKKAEAFKALYGENFKILLFVFEGNDFAENRLSEQEWSSQFLLRLFDSYRRYFYFSAFRKTVFTFTQNRIKRFQRTLAGAPQPSDIATSFPLTGNLNMVFYNPYLAVTKREEKYEDDILRFAFLLNQMRPQLEHVFFIPTKFRVYNRYFDGDFKTKELPNRQWEHLEATCRKLGIQVTNLTDALAEEAGVLLGKGLLVYWRDDTHWNCQGASVAAGEIAKVLS